MKEAVDHDPSAGLAAAAAARRLDRLTTGEAFEWTFVVLAVWVVAGAYFDAWTYVNNPSGYSGLAPWQDSAVHAGWLALTLWLAIAGARRVGLGMPWNRSLPAGYDVAFAAAVALGLLFQVDSYEQLLFGNLRSLENLVSPVRVLEIIAGTVLVTGPLRASWKRGDPSLSPQAVASAVMLLAAISFFTQFAQPLRDLGQIASGPAPRPPLDWIFEDYGVAAVLLQSSILVAFALVLIRRFRVHPGTFLLVFTADGILVAALKAHYEMPLAAAAAGTLADLGLLWFRPAAVRPRSVRVFAICIGSGFAAAIAVVLVAAHGTWWGWPLWTGLPVAAGVSAYLVSHLVFPSPRAQPARGAGPMSSDGGSWGEGRAVDLKAIELALESIDDPGRLAENPLVELACLSGPRPQRTVELRELLIDAVQELAGSKEPRDAEAGRLLLDYYVRRVGTHEVVAERLHLSRPTLFRRRQRGLARVAEMVDELTEARSR